LLGPIEMTKQSQNERLVYDGRRFQVHEIQVTNRDGRPAAREVIRHPGAVVILPILPDGSIVMIRNYRVSIDRTLLELPAGTLEPDEPPESTAYRELEEETGYIASSVSLLASFYSSPGICDELMCAYVAEGLSEGPPKREAGEEIENQAMPWSDVLAALRNGHIQDAKSIAALLLYQLKRQDS
jgi:ADP-ribose pyrophosphatase